MIFRIINGFDKRYDNSKEFSAATHRNPLVRRKNWVPLGVVLMNYKVFLDNTTSVQFKEYFDFCEKNTSGIWSCNHNSFYFKNEIDTAMFRLVL